MTVADAGHKPCRAKRRQTERGGERAGRAAVHRAAGVGAEDLAARIDMPLSTTLELLHEAIQMTMGWTFSHLWEFDIDGRCYGDPSFREFDDEPPVYKAKGIITLTEHA